MANAPTPINTNTNMTDASSMTGFLAMPAKFLVLCPASSSNYPYAAPVSAPESPQDASAAAPINMTKAVSVLSTSASRIAETLAPAKPEVSLDAAKVRSPSVSSDRSSGSSSTTATQTPRFLKLGPVHYGQGDGADDFSYPV